MAVSGYNAASLLGGPYLNSNVSSNSASAFSNALQAGDSKDSFSSHLKETVQEFTDTVKKPESMVLNHLSTEKVDENSLIDAVNQMSMMLEVGASLREKLTETIKQIQNMPI